MTMQMPMGHGYYPMRRDGCDDDHEQDREHNVERDRRDEHHDERHREYSPTPTDE